MHKYLLVISYAALVFSFISLIFSVYGERADNKRRRLEHIKGKHENLAYLELEQTFFRRVIEPLIKKFAKIFKKIVPRRKDKVAEKSKKVAALERQLRLAGMYVSVEEYSFTKTTIMVLVTFISLFSVIILELAVLYRLLVFLVGVTLGVMGPTLYLRSRVRSHQEGIRSQLPDAMDLLGVCIEAGLSFDSSLLKIAEKLKGPFIDELLIVHREMQMGRARRVALRNLSEASEIEELKTFASALAQAEQLGIPINNVMRVQSKQLRATRKAQAQEKGMKATIKMLLPMLVFIFPTIFIIIMGPTVMNILDAFG